MTTLTLEGTDVSKGEMPVDSPNRGASEGPGSIRVQATELAQGATGVERKDDEKETTRLQAIEAARILGTHDKATRSGLVARLVAFAGHYMSLVGSLTAKELGSFWTDVMDAMGNGTLQRAPLVKMDGEFWPKLPKTKGQQKASMTPVFSKQYLAPYKALARWQYHLFTSAEVDSMAARGASPIVSLKDGIVFDRPVAMLEAGYGLRETVQAFRDVINPTIIKLDGLDTKLYDAAYAAAWDPEKLTSSYRVTVKVPARKGERAFKASKPVTTTAGGVYGAIKGLLSCDKAKEMRSAHLADLRTIIDLLAGAADDPDSTEQ